MYLSFYCLFCQTESDYQYFWTQSCWSRFSWFTWVKKILQSQTLFSFFSSPDPNVSVWALTPNQKRRSSINGCWGHDLCEPGRGVSPRWGRSRFCSSSPTLLGHKLRHTSSPFTVSQSDHWPGIRFRCCFHWELVKVFLLSQLAWINALNLFGTEPESSFSVPENRVGTKMSTSPIRHRYVRWTVSDGSSVLSVTHSCSSQDELW